MTAPESLDLTKPRTLGPLLSDGLGIWFRHLARFSVIGFVVVAPAEAIVSGVGLEQFGAGYDANPGLAASLIPLAVQSLVTSPLIVAMTVFMLNDLAGGEKPSALRAIQRGLDAFAPVFVPVVASIAVEILAVLVLVLPLALVLGFAFPPTIIVPIILAVRWYFTPQAVVAGGARGLQALRDSWELTRVPAWRVAGIVFLTLVVFQTVGGLLVTPIVALAKALDSAAILVGADVVGQTLYVPAIAIVVTLLYHDLRARQRAAV